MRVAVYYTNHDVRIEERPRPCVGPGEVLLKIMASGICGSDVMEWYRVRTAPRVLGHEVTGEVVETGPGVERFRPGDRVFAAHHVPCNTCPDCLAGHETACPTLHATNFDPGGFAEYVRLPALNVDRGTLALPEAVGWEEGTFVEPLACVVRSHAAAGLAPGRSVLVLGAGISGLLHVLLARASAAGWIGATDLHASRLERALALGADRAWSAAEYDPSLLREANRGRLADLVVVCTSAFSAFEQALASVERGGTVLLFAPTDPGVDLPVPVHAFWRRNIRLVHSYGSGPADNFTALRLLAAGRLPVREIITHRLPLTDAARGFALMADDPEALKVLLLPHGTRAGDPPS